MMRAGAAMTLFVGVMLSMPWATAQAQQRLIHEEKSLYRQVLVYEDAGTRCLCFTRRCAIGRQSCVDLSHPQRLVFEYTRMMLGALFMEPPPKDVLVIGLGGGTLPQALAQLLPEAQIDVVEIDPAVVRVAQQYFNFRTGAHMHVFEQDGRAYVRRVMRTARRYDLVMLDAYDSQYIPEHLLTREFLQEVQTLLRPGAVLAANTFSSSRLYQNESVTYHSVFGDFYNLKSDNRVILVRNGGLPSMSAVTAAADRYQAQFAAFGVTPETVLRHFSTQVDWDPSARVLTDQYSPANLLNAR